MSTHEHFMGLAIKAAEQARGRTSPNPMVGAVITCNDQVVATGYHRKAGMPHAEIEALRAFSGDPSVCTMYVNLEPCSHTGRTGPCTTALIEAGIKKVIVGVQDPDPRVNGRGLRLLREAGIEVEVGILEPACRELNAPFFTYIEKQRPLVSMKVAMSLDAAIATRTGDARWLSSKEARTWGHKMRDEVDAILVGANTVIADDPALTVRHVEGQDPLRIVLDSRLRTPLDAQLYRPPLAAGTQVFTCTPEPEALTKLRDAGVSVHVVSADDEGHVSLPAVMEHLYEQKIQHLLLEGGGMIHGAFMKQALVDRLWMVITPWMLGQGARPAFSLPGADTLAESITFCDLQSTPIGPDILLKATPNWNHKPPPPLKKL